MLLSNKTVVLGITGGIAAYKMPNVAHALVKLGAEVHVLMTKNATEFISPLVFETLTRRRCQVDTFDRNFQYDVAHISLANAAELFKGILCNGGHAVFSNYWELGLTSLQEEILLYAGIAILLAVDAAHECGVSLRTKIAALPTPARWAVYEVCIFVFLFMGRFLGGGSFLYARY